LNFSPITHGRPVTHLRTPGFAITEATYPAGYAIPKHNHESASLTFVLAGSLAESVHGRTETLAPRELLLKPAATAHSNTIGHKGARLLLVEVIEPDFAGPAVQRAFQRPNRVSAPMAAAPLLRVGDELERGDTYSSICIEGLLLQLIGDMARVDSDHTRTGAEPLFLRRLRERLHEDLHKPLRIADLAASEGVPAARLSREFKRRYGCGIGDYLRRIRLEKAMNFLATSSEAISTVALTSGFADQSHLTRELRRATGLTPRQYREQTRNS
jgi:AraC family transcriptional regulator